MEKINKPNPPQRLFGKAKQLSIIKQNALQTVNPANGATTKVVLMGLFVFVLVNL